MFNLEISLHLILLDTVGKREKLSYENHSILTNSTYGDLTNLQLEHLSKAKVSLTACSNAAWSVIHACKMKKAKFSIAGPSGSIGGPVGVKRAKLATCGAQGNSTGGAKLYQWGQRYIGSYVPYVRM